MRVVATGPQRPRPVADRDLTALITRAGAAHALTVIDVGTVRASHAAAALHAASRVIWTLRSEPTAAATARELLGSPLVGALGARQAIAVLADRRRRSPDTGALMRVADAHAERLVRVAESDELAAQPPNPATRRARRVTGAFARFLAVPCTA